MRDGTPLIQRLRAVYRHPDFENAIGAKLKRPGEDYVSVARVLNVWPNFSRLGVVKGITKDFAFVSPIEYQSIEPYAEQLLTEGKKPFILALDRITDVRNFGAIARTAACAGAHGILVPEKGSAPLSADAVRTSAGALMKIPVCRTQSLYGSIKMLKNSGVKIVGATEKTSEVLFDADLTGPIAIVLGDEETGLSVDTWKLCDAHVKIPLSAKGVGSLNVSVAAGVITYEVVRQRAK